MVRSQGVFLPSGPPQIGISSQPGGGSSVLPTPLATAWALAVTANGGTYSANTFTALQELERDLTYAELTSKFIYLNTRCGNDITAAKVPLIATSGPAYDVLSGTVATWNEVDGLNGTSGVADTGVVASTCGISTSAVSYGVYMLENASATNEYVIGDHAQEPPDHLLGHTGLVPAAFASYTLFDNFDGGGSGRTQTDSSLLADGNLTKGLMCGSRNGLNAAAVYRNGDVRGQSTGLTNGPIPATTLKYFTERGPSGGDFIGLALTPEDVSNFTWIIHTFNVALNRGVTAEGLF